ncbi:hypothetical protein CVT25_004302 [Psilocybe cyanescens]|uniref:Uncharacterized protein n=1 Tax=Psilocybe cyanescens TaxID=93625 RepID=A0A409VW23_PSICY|nr:hypothetical protein CVT25_004302 [Psilocybe cyanescens]
MSTPDPFGFHSQCTKEGIDTQLMTDTFANTINTTFTFRCCSTFIGFGCIDQPVLPFHTCGEANQNVADYASMTFCIGGLFEQHACAADGCQQISRAGVISQQCPQQLIDYMKVQPVGAQFACCDSSSCVVGTDYTCPTSRSLQLCVGDGIGAECLNPQNLAICSGNYTSTVSGDSPQTPSGQGGTAPNSDTTLGERWC